MDEDRGRSAERLVTFTDAVVAIAITLLALPLTEFSKTLVDQGFGAVLAGKWFGFLGFAISFFVIARLWWGHHRLFAHVIRWDTTVVSLTTVWLFSVVLIAPVTAITTSFDASEQVDGHYVNRGVIALYIGTMAVSSALLTALAWHVRRHPDLTDGRDGEAGRRLAGTVASTVGFLGALAIGTAFPVVNYFAILLLVVAGRVGDVVERRRERRARRS